MGCSGSASKLGLHSGRLYSCPDSPNCVSSQAPEDDAEHFISPIVYKGNPVQARERLLEIILAQKRVQLIVNHSDYILAEFSSSLFGFIDDVEFYLVPQDNTTQIEVRSLSRVGYSDFGVNRKRIENIRHKMQCSQ